MSEPISAFSAYNANGIKKSPGNKKNKAAKKAAKSPGGSQNTAQSNGTPTMNGKDNGDNVQENKTPPNANGGHTIKQPKTTIPTEAAMLVTDTEPTQKSKKKQKQRKSSGQLQANGTPNKEHVEEPQSAKKKLSKAEKKKKKLQAAEQQQQQAAADEQMSEAGAAALPPEHQPEENGKTTETESDAQASPTAAAGEQQAKPKKAKANKKAKKRKSDEAAAVINENGANEHEAVQAKIVKKDSSAPLLTPKVSQGAIPKRPSAAAAAESTQSVGHRYANVKLEPLSPPSNITKMNSITEGLKVFRWLLNPIKVEDFYSKYWERNACLVKRQQDSYYKQLISFEAIDQMLLKHHVEFTKNLDVTSYKNGVRETLNPPGRALPPVVWDHYGRGCSIRLLNPQTFLPALFTLCTTMQEYFHCLVGANAYLTPPNSQGFAPHYDDIEAFVLQIEGRKRWKLYKPRSKAEELPRVSSRNFDQSEIGKPILEEVLSPGDILYFPRGTIHQACTEPGHHSLHITLSVYQKQSYADLFEKMVPLMLQRAIESSVELRRGLPLHTWQHAGIAFSDNDTKERQELVKNVSQLFTKCLRETAVAEVMDAAVDQLAKKYQHEALPPEILPSERARTIFGSKSITDEQGECVCDYEIDLRTNVRLLRANIMRLVHEEQKIRLYYYLSNSKEYCEYEANYIEIEPEDAGSVEVLIKSYPAYVSVSQLPIEDDERKISMVTALWENGLLMLEKPLH